MSVKSWGKGRPDYMKAVIASRPVVIDAQLEQINMIIHKRFTIAAGGSAIDNFYTVPAGYNLALGGGHISVKDSCINKLRVVTANQELIGDFRYDMRGDFAMTSLAGQEISAGTILIAYIFNNDAIESQFSLVITGVLSRE